MSIPLVSFSTKFFRDGAIDKGGTKFALVALRFVFHSAVLGCFVGLIFQNVI